MVCRRHHQEAFGLLASMAGLANRLGADCDDHACLVLAGVIRDSASAIRSAVEQPAAEAAPGQSVERGRKAGKWPSAS
jgi:hypothetical protein